MKKWLSGHKMHRTHSNTSANEIELEFNKKLTRERWHFFAELRYGCSENSTQISDY